MVYSRSGLDNFEPGEVIGLDVETSSLDIYDPETFLIGLAVTNGIHSYYYEYDEIPYNDLQTLVRTHPIVCHNLKFDLAVLLQHNIVPEMPCYCTLSIAHMIDENAFDKSLNALSKKYLNKSKIDLNIADIIDIFGARYVPRELVEPYCINDAKLTLGLYQYFMPIVKLQELDHLLIREYEFTKRIINMERLGIKIDYKLCVEQIKLGVDKMNNLQLELGFDPAKSTQLAKFLFDELKLPVLKTTKTGKPSMDKSVMDQYDEILEATNKPEAKMVLEYRGWQKAISTYYKKAYEIADYDDVIHPSFRLQGTKTGRLSCASPNMQQIPRVSDKPWSQKVKQIFIPRDPNYTLIEADYSQLELRLVAAYSQEEKLLEIFKDPTRDIFTEMSKQLNLTRYEAKTLTYAIMYGAGVTRIKNLFKVSPERATDIIDNFYKTYPGIQQLNRYVKSQVEKYGYIRYWNKRRRHLTTFETHKAMNSLIQGGAAELVKETMLKVPNDSQCMLLLQIHDALVFEVNRSNLNYYAEEISNVMIDFPQFDVPLTVDIHPWSSK